MGSLGEAGGKDFVLNISNPILTELNRLENLLKDKDRELGAAQNEIKALKGSEFLKDKAVLELSSALRKLEQKLGNAEKQAEDKNLEIKRLICEKKAALSAQLAAEATLRRIHASQKEADDSVSAGALIAPLEAEIKMCKNEISALQEDRKASDRLMKSKELALVEAERSLNAALERALMVENLQNQNTDLKRQVEICLEENKFLEKTNHQKVVEVEKLSQTIRELEECILVGGKAANTVRDYQRQVAESNEVIKTLERELAKAKISVNRVATVVANEWKDEGDKLMPVKQWLEERKSMQGEIQRLKDKLVISERSAKAEAQLKEKIKLRLRTLEDGFKQSTTSTIKTTNCAENIISSSPNNVKPKRSMSQPRGSLSAASKFSVKQQSNSATRIADSCKTMQRSNSQKGKFISSENLIKKNLWVSKSKFYDESGKENIAKKNNVEEHVGDSSPKKNDDSKAKLNENHATESSQNTENQQELCNDTVSGFLYDKLQKEVISLRKLQEEKDELLNAKEDDINLLKRKIDALTKAMEVEAKSIRRAVATREKEVLQKSEDNKPKNRNTNMVRR